MRIRVELTKYDIEVLIRKHICERLMLEPDQMGYVMIEDLPESQHVSASFTLKEETEPS